ncbi:unnamed protein product [Clavelina lepadiformis]|uniref:Death domain-containing protein n=1 Tax=Clavelina lepadiformis TaxID=159417 RepID=A0ABP0G0D4_CLALP
MDGQHATMPSTMSSCNNTVEDVLRGCVMHRYKGYKRKRRWGELRVEMNNNSARCIIQLFKHDMLSLSSDAMKAKEPKLKFEIQFSREDFCGLEKGDHFDRYGTRRYLCIITKDKHIIIEDAVMTATGVNHNVLGTWYQYISHVMGYVDRWKVIESDPKLAKKICYLHLTTENISECHSLEDKTRENRSCLVLRSWRCRNLSQIFEQASTTDSATRSDITFLVSNDFGTSMKVSITVEGTPQLLQRFQKHNIINGEENKPKGTIFPGFDDLNPSHNLVRIPVQQTPKGIRAMLTKTKSMKGTPREEALDMEKAKKLNRHSLGNLYVKLDHDNEDVKSHESEQPVVQSYYNVRPPCIETDRNSPRRCNHNDEPSASRKGAPCFHDSNPRVCVPPSLIDQSPTRCFAPEFVQPASTSLAPPNGLAPRSSPPQLPSPGFDDNHLKKGPGLATQISFDSDYQTGENMTTLLTENDVPHCYVNVHASDNDSNRTGSLGRPRPNVAYENIAPEPENLPPALPARDDHPLSVPSYINIKSQPPPRPPKSNLPATTEPSRFDMQVAEPSNNFRAPPLPSRQSLHDEDMLRPDGSDILVSSIQRGTLPPLPGEDPQRGIYENKSDGSDFEVAISEVLLGTHLSNSRWLDLPHVIFLGIAFGLEKEEVTVGGWRAFAERLGLRFSDIQQLASLARSHSTLRPFEVLLFHWIRTQCPVPCSRNNLREILIEIGREDLAQTVPSDIAKKE